eukprot:TRINITY_DN63552_c0_g1_i1.p1 TRINITY_DN63552_c0_g1~~TRINITY_DN63552_c0_g1_i1.p1  ORF type:complete len:895 (-),score=148.63 TRINITY_DN63552_c0_g1_i1:35-2635(-)
MPLELPMNDRTRLQEKMRQRRAKSETSETEADADSTTERSQLISGEAKLSPHVFAPFSQSGPESAGVDKSWEQRSPGALSQLGSALKKAAAAASPAISPRSDDEPLVRNDTEGFDSLAASIFADADALQEKRRVSAAIGKSVDAGDSIDTPRGSGSVAGEWGKTDDSSDIEVASTRSVPSPPVASSNFVSAGEVASMQSKVTASPRDSTAEAALLSSTASASKFSFIPMLRLNPMDQASSPPTEVESTRSNASMTSRETPRKVSPRATPRNRAASVFARVRTVVEGDGGGKKNNVSTRLDDDTGNPFADSVCSQEAIAAAEAGKALNSARSSVAMTPRRKSSGSVAVGRGNIGFGKVGGLGVFAGPGQSTNIGGGFGATDRESSDSEESEPTASSATTTSFFRRATWFAGRTAGVSQEDSVQESDQCSAGSHTPSTKEKFASWRRSLTFPQGVPSQNQGRWTEIRTRASVVATGAALGLSQVARKTRAKMGREKSSASDALPNYPDANKYIANETLWNALDNEYAVLIKGSWLRKRASSSNIKALPRRQDLVEKYPSAVWKLEELFELMSSGSVVVIAVSHSWITQDHPDPTGSQLRVLGHALGKMIDGSSVEDLAVFYDWCSLYQRPRCPMEEAMYNYSREDVSLWFAHTGTRVWMLTQQNEAAVDTDDEDYEEASCAVPYAERGWTNFERALGEMATQSRFLMDLGKMDSVQIQASNWHQIATICRAERRPPLTPQAFEEFIRTKKFGDGDADREFVTQKYASLFFDLIIASPELSYSDLDWTDVEVQKLVEVLPHCSRLRTLVLHGNSIGHDGAVALAKVLPRCPSLKELWLTGNPLCKHRKAKELLRQAWAFASLPADALHF